MIEKHNSNEIGQSVNEIVVLIKKCTLQRVYILKGSLFIIVWDRKEPFSFTKDGKIFHRNTNIRH